MLLAVAFHLSGAAPQRLVVYLVLAAAARIGVAIIPTIPGAETSSRQGKMHLLLAVASFALSYMSLSVGADVLTAAPAASAVAMLAVALRWIALVSLVGVIVCLFGPLRPVFGLVERVFLLSVTLFMLLASVDLDMLAWAENL